jgi:hypothetical protein
VSAPGGSDPVAPVGGGMFEVNIAEAPRAIRELELAAEELRAIQRDAISLAQVNPPALDEVSLDAAAELGRRANGGPQSLSEALTQGIAEVERVIEALRAGFAAYRSGDEEGSAAYSSQL